MISWFPVCSAMKCAVHPFLLVALACAAAQGVANSSLTEGTLLCASISAFQPLSFYALTCAFVCRAGLLRDDGQQ